MYDMTHLEIYANSIPWSKGNEKQLNQYEHDFLGLMHDKYGFVESASQKPVKIPLGLHGQARALHSKDEKLVYITQHEERTYLTTITVLIGKDRERLDSIVESTIRFHDSRGYINKGRITL